MQTLDTGKLAYVHSPTPPLTSLRIPGLSLLYCFVLFFCSLVHRQPRPQGFSLKKWRGWFIALP